MKSIYYSNKTIFFLLCLLLIINIKIPLSAKSYHNLFSHQILIISTEVSSVEKKVQKKIEAKKVLNIKITTQQDLYQKQEYSSFRKKLQEIKTKSNLQGF